MIQANSRVTINTALINKMTQAGVRALEQTTEALHNEIQQAQVIPRDTGALQGEKMHVDYKEAINGKTRIIHEGPYARRLYFHPEYNYRTDENPNARGEWFKPWLPGGINEEFAVEAFRKFYKKEAGL